MIEQTLNINGNVTLKYDFVTDKFKLGGICKNNHIYLDSGMTLRYKITRNCVICTSIRAKTYREENKEKMSIGAKVYYIKNKSKINTTHKLYRDNKDTACEYFKKYRNTKNGKAVGIRSIHKRRALKIGNGGEYTTLEWNNTLNEFFNKCAYCGCDERMTIDHVVPLSSGGTSFISNIIPSCGKCNSNKHAKSLHDWYPKQPFFTQERLDRIVKHMEE